MRSKQILIIDSESYNEITERLVQGAVQVLEEEGLQYRRITVPSMLEIPIILRYAIRSMEIHSTDISYAGYIVIGSILGEDNAFKKEIFHEAMKHIQNISVKFSLALGNGLIYADYHERAMEIADINSDNEGGMAAKRCLKMLKIKNNMGL
ncbi:MAG: 6,7-dimethyl-8-ribityllumazine synthase [Alphaproteobacteria bacterium]|nr:6,7-dimethyl-8-ribityllumazine synthase [Alphaproteobacteria bacterium]